MLDLSLWISGDTRSGKTTRLVEVFRQWTDRHASTNDSSTLSTPKALVFAANDDTRRELATRLSTAIEGRYPIFSKTPLGFFSDQVTLFWPLLFKQLTVKPQFPLRLRPETEQALATRLWESQLNSELFQRTGIGEYRLVRRILDLMQLAGASGTPIEDIPTMLEQGLVGQEWETLVGANALLPLEMPQLWEEVGQLLQDWKRWCLQRGLLTYGIIYELYWRYLLPDNHYQGYLRERYSAVFADDVDDYPAIARNLFDFLLDSGADGVFTYNPNGAVRLGLNADPEH
ncbi:MAG: recombinase family protein, partial [Chroococcales cyanobacterium]